VVGMVNTVQSGVRRRAWFVSATTGALMLSTVAVASAQSDNSPDANQESVVQGANASAVDYVVRGFTGAAATRKSVGTRSSVQPLRAKSGTPGPVRKLKIAKTTKRQAKISWKKPRHVGGSAIKGYHFRLKIVGKGWKRWKPIKLSQLKSPGSSRFVHKRKRLQPGTSYRVQVKAKNRNGFGKKRSLRFLTGGQNAVQSWSYSYNVNDPQYRDPKGGKDAREFWFSQDGGLLEEIETTQFVDEAPKYLTVKAPNDTQCLSVFEGTGSAEFTTVRGDGSDPIKLRRPSIGRPQHLTLLPWWSRSDSCDLKKDLVAYDESVVLAVFVSATYWAEPPPNSTVCRISPADAKAINKMYWQDNGAQGWTSSNGECVIDKPQVRGDIYTGTLYSMLTSKDSGPLFIELEAGATLTAPLNGMVIETSDPNGFGAYCLLAPKRQIIVTGFGRLDGSEVNRRYQDRFEGVGKPAHYAIDSGQLFLGSRYESGFGIDVSGITAANGAVRNETSVGLNDGNHWHCGDDGRPDSGSPGYEGSPVKVYDFKRPAVWWYGSDSLEVSADSEVSFAYMHSADDAIKISAPRQTWRNISVIQGGIGAVINIGSYGYNSGTEGTVVKGVSVPRITHTLASDGMAGYDDRNGLIATRTCSQHNQRGEPQSVTGVRVSDFTVHSLGGNPQSGVGPNSYLRPFALGVIGDTNRASKYAPFCNRWQDPEGSFRSKSNAVMGDFTFTNFNIFQNPLRNSLIYDGNQVLGSDKSTTWKPIRFCAASDRYCETPVPGPDDASNRPVTFWPSGDRSGPGYYVCGIGAGGDASQCWTTANLFGPTSTMVNNVDYVDGQYRLEGSGSGYNIGTNVVYPYGP
jgi:hypothetical protein